MENRKKKVYDQDRRKSRKEEGIHCFRE